MVKPCVGFFWRYDTTQHLIRTATRNNRSLNTQQERVPLNQLSLMTSVSSAVREYWGHTTVITASRSTEQAFTHPRTRGRSEMNEIARADHVTLANFHQARQ